MNKRLLVLLIIVLIALISVGSSRFNNVLIRLVIIAGVGGILLKLFIFTIAIKKDVSEQAKTNRTTSLAMGGGLFANAVLYILLPAAAITAVIIVVALLVRN